MNKKVYFLISSIIQIIISCFTITHSKEIIESILSNIEIYPEIIQNRIIKIYSNFGFYFIIIMAIICIIFNFFIAYFAYKNKLSEKRKIIIILSILVFFTSNTLISELMAIINTIVIASDRERKSEVKNLKTIPVLNPESNDLKKIIKAIILFIIYFSQIVWKKYLTNDIWGLVIPIIFYLLMIILCIWFFFDLFKNNYLVFKQNFNTYISYIFTKIGIFYVIFIVVSIICVLVTKSFPANQSAIEKLPLWLSFPLAIIYAPIVEETLFRGCIRRFINEKYLFIIVSGITFGLLHTINAESSLLNMLVLAIPYGVIGSLFAYMYTKTNNILTNISCHFFFNLVAMIITLIINII